MNTKRYYELENQTLTEGDLERILQDITGYIYVFATASCMRWTERGEIKYTDTEHPEGFFQLMPDTNDEGFFNWYCSVRPEHQFHPTRQGATLHFLYYHHQWKKMDSPKSF
jgi:hypothetical protein